MQYCADTWFMLYLFGKEPKALSILQEARKGQSTIIIPLVAYAETAKKLMQRAVKEQEIDEFFETVEQCRHVNLVYPDKKIAREAARVSLAYSVPLIDAFVAATFRMTGSHILLTADSDYELLAKRKYAKIQCW